MRVLFVRLTLLFSVLLFVSILIYSFSISVLAADILNPRFSSSLSSWTCDQRFSFSSFSHSEDGTGSALVTQWGDGTGIFRCYQDVFVDPGVDYFGVWVYSSASFRPDFRVCAGPPGSVLDCGSWHTPGSGQWLWVYAGVSDLVTQTATYRFAFDVQVSNYDGNGYVDDVLFSEDGVTTSTPTSLPTYTFIPVVLTVEFPTPLPTSTSTATPTSFPWGGGGYGTPTSVPVPTPGGDDDLGMFSVPGFIEFEFEDYVLPSLVIDWDWADVYVSASFTYRYIHSVRVLGMLTLPLAPVGFALFLFFVLWILKLR